MLQSIFEYTLYYLNVSSEIRWERIKQCNLEKGKTFQFEITKENFDFMETWFETLDL